MKPLVSVVIPTFNCEGIMKDCLESVKKQTYKPVEIIVVDSFSTDNTAKIAAKYGKVYSFGKDPKDLNTYAAPFQRNYGGKKAKGKYIYWIDSDMRLTPRLVASAIKALEKNNADAVIVPEVSYGESFWANCRALEKACYNRSDRSYTDAARVIKKTVWDKLKGLNAHLGSTDDYDFQTRLDAKGYKTIKIKQYVRHYEGRLTLMKQIKKKFIYGKTALGYFKKYQARGRKLAGQYSRPEFLQHHDLLIKDPLHAVGMIIMKFVEYAAGFTGLVYAMIVPQKIQLRES